MKVTRLLFWSAVSYGVLLFLIRATLPSESLPAISLTGIPLIVIAVIIARDLSRRSTSPTSRIARAVDETFKGNPVQFLSGQIKVAASASDSYFENVVRSRLKELLISKVALETGLDAQAVRRQLSDPRQGPRLLRDPALHGILYGPVPETKHDKMRMIQEAIDMIGAWGD